MSPAGQDLLLKGEKKKSELNTHAFTTPHLRISKVFEIKFFDQ